MNDADAQAIHFLAWWTITLAFAFFWWLLDNDEPPTSKA